MTLFKTDALASIFVPDDGSLLTIAFKTSKGSKVELEIPTVQARPIVQQIMGAVVNAETRSNLAKQGVFGGLNPTRTAVGATEDRQEEAARASCRERKAPQASRVEGRHREGDAR